MSEFICTINFQFKQPKLQQQKRKKIDEQEQKENTRRQSSHNRIQNTDWIFEKDQHYKDPLSEDQVSLISKKN